MLEYLLWKTVEQRPTYDNNGYLKWLVLERHRIHGHYRTTLVDEHWDATHAKNFTTKVGEAKDNEPR